ncbi:Predicted nucleic acid-binding protein, contains PIN domain [Xaviernesmea oryzae]|uniref:Predicted nucleic acid-binding protein, contains PIN domain n=1 Tax=Xaviernesmea oryzae TaxID=464029 RepID=A0A1X7F4W7_9HYPH|nr:PIN domain-containing protein [Xaviernesmea oryzae]SMF45322.1 Predicted nucleic acid-binding protein, contains PIN domain [Xaviernesmea oryzae]
MPLVANFLDTNILVYAFSEGPKAEVAQALMAEPFVLSVQALNEFANVGRKKLKLSWERIEEAIDALSFVASAIVTLEQQTTKAALELVGRYNLAFYDALMLAAALKADCSRYYSEDLQHGLLVEEKLTVINPFR